MAANDPNVQKPVNIICIKWGTRYPAHYVNRLFAMVSRNLAMPFRFVCFTDDANGLDSRIERFPIPDIRLPSRETGGWRKLALLAPKLADLEGPALFLDLDLVITEDLGCFFDHPGELCMIENWTQRGSGVGNSSVFRFEVGSLADAYGRFNADPNLFASRYPNEQSYLSLTEKSVTVSFWPKAWVKNFKLHCMPFVLFRPFQIPRIPRGACVILFSSHPKMEEAASGITPWRRPKHFKPSVPWYWLPVPWIRDIWREDPQP